MSKGAEGGDTRVRPAQWGPWSLETEVEGGEQRTVWMEAGLEIFWKPGVETMEILIGWAWERLCSCWQSAPSLSSQPHLKVSVPFEKTAAHHQVSKAEGHLPHVLFTLLVMFVTTVLFIRFYGFLIQGNARAMMVPISLALDLFCYCCWFWPLLCSWNSAVVIVSGNADILSFSICLLQQLCILKRGHVPQAVQHQMCFLAPVGSPDLSFACIINVCMSTLFCAHTISKPPS